MMDMTDLFDSEYVYIGKDEKYHIKDEAPEELKKQFKDFFSESDEEGVITLT